jgi:tetratricopeptide (TPR) repeat protein
LGLRCADCRAGAQAWLGAVLILGAAFAVVGGAAASRARADDIRDGERLFNTGDYAKCVEMAQGEIDRGNYLEQWRVLKIKSLLAVGNYEAAMTAADDALAEFPTSLALRLLSHDAAQAGGQTARAATELSMIERFATSDPQRYSSPGSRVALGRYFLSIGADARQVLQIFYDPVVKSWPEYVDGHLASAELSLAKFDNKLAVETLKKAPEAAKENPEFHYLLARAYSEDDGEEAEKELAAALEVNPRHVKSLLLRANQFIDAEQYDDANTALDEALAVNAREPIAWAYKAVLANLKFDAKGEQAARENALKDWADNPEVDYTIGKKLSDKYRFAEGAAYQRKALQAKADYLPAKMQLSQDLLRLGQEDEGWTLASTVFNADGYNVVAHNLVTLHDTVKESRTTTSACGWRRARRRSTATACSRCSTARRRRCARNMTRR